MSPIRPPIIDVDAYKRVRLALAHLEFALGRTDGQPRWQLHDIDTLLLQWDRFTPEFWADDRTLVQDYFAFLRARDRLERFIVAADPETASFLQTLVEPTDAAFTNASVDRDPGLAALYRVQDPGWWWMRTPIALGRMLRSELGAPADEESPPSDSHQR